MTGQTSHHAFFNRALTYDIRNEHDNALRDYSIVLLLCNDPKAYRNRGLLYWKLGDTENAILDLYAARNAYPDDAKLRGLLALALHKVSRNDESIREYDAVG